MSRGRHFGLPRVARTTCGNAGLQRVTRRTQNNMSMSDHVNAPSDVTYSYCVLGLISTVPALGCYGKMSIIVV
jgi:hypothetical protein